MEEGDGVEGFGLVDGVLVLFCFQSAYMSEVGWRGGKGFSWSFEPLLFGCWSGVGSIEAREKWENVRIGKPSLSAFPSWVVTWYAWGFLVACKAGGIDKVKSG